MFVDGTVVYFALRGEEGVLGNDVVYQYETLQRSCSHLV